ncbi:MAG: ABC transporter ATP-binding protein, partial [Alphaproteobacteria bacterium]
MLEVRGLVVNYGKIRAVRGISLDVAEGEIVALIGANGAGKSSTMNAVCGIVKSAAGEARFRGERITGLASHTIVRRGIVQVPEGRQIFAGLTIEENLRVGAYAAGDRGAIRREMDAVLELFPMLKLRLGDRASNLSGGQLQMLALARGMMARPSLLMLDEPSLGLAPVT